jgi:hypothetical protein
MKMKILGAIAACAVLVVTQAQAQNLLVNDSFELPGTAKIQTGFDTVPGWFSGGLATDSGVEWTATPVGAMAAFMKASDPVWANQTAIGYLGQPTDWYFGLTFMARPGYTFDASWGTADATMHVEVWYGGTATSAGTVFVSAGFDLGTLNGGPFTQYSLASLLPAAAIGQPLGVSFRNTSGLGIDPYSGVLADPTKSWIGLDGVVLQVPEPGAIGLLSLALGCLTILRRRAR